MGIFEWDSYYLVFSVESFAYLFEQAYLTERHMTNRRLAQQRNGKAFPTVPPQDVRQFAIEELDAMLSLVVLKVGCVHKQHDLAQGCPPTLAD